MKWGGDRNCAADSQVKGAIFLREKGRYYRLFCDPKHQLNYNRYLRTPPSVRFQRPKCNEERMPCIFFAFTHDIRLLLSEVVASVYHPKLSPTILLGL